MKQVKFKLLPAFHSDGTPMTGWYNICLIVDEDVLYTWEVNSYFNTLTEEQKQHMYFDLIPRKDWSKFLKGTHQEYDLGELYQKWYEYEFFVDGEDAFEFIYYAPGSKNARHFQASCGILYGWKYYKRLRQHDFNKSLCADLAYWRGYITGMDLNAPWDAEGEEALDCLDLKYTLPKSKRYD